MSQAHETSCFLLTCLNPNADFLNFIIFLILCVCLLLWFLEEGAGLVVNMRLKTTLPFRAPAMFCSQAKLMPSATEFKYWLSPDTPLSDVISTR